MNPSPFEIWLATIEVRESVDARPCVVIKRISDTEILVVPISTAMPLMNATFDFKFSSWHPDFAKSGLRKDSFAIGNLARSISPGAFIKKWGKLEGELAAEFGDWI